MDYTEGREQPANLPPMENAPENSGQAQRAELAAEAYSGKAMHRLESDMGLPGYLSGGSAGSEKRLAPAPYYPQEAKANPKPGTIPVMPGVERSSGQTELREKYLPPPPPQDFAPQPGSQNSPSLPPFDQSVQPQDQQYVVPAPGQNLQPQDQQYVVPAPGQNLQPQDQQYWVAPPGQNVQPPQDQQYWIAPPEQDQNSDYDQSYQNQPYVNPNQYYTDPRGYRDAHRFADPESGMTWEQRRFVDQNQFVDVQRRAQQERYVRQSDYINGNIFFNSQRPIERALLQTFMPGDAYKRQWWEETQYPINPNQRYQPSRNPELDHYRSQWWQQSQYPSEQRYYPGRNPQLDPYREQWWNQSNYPSDQRNNPGRNPDLNWYQNQWWQNAQTRPNTYDRNVGPRQPVPVDYNNRYYPDQLPNSYDRTQAEYFARAINSVVGHSINEYDRSVPENLGCARAVSLVLEKTYGLPIREQSNDGLENSIRYYGWDEVDPNSIQPGDVIIARRPNGLKGHSGIYLGNDQVFNNNSHTLRMQIESAAKFRTGEFSSIKVFRKVR